ncbi:MAG: V-type ATPase 116kDa subunit family protein [Vicinamibacterales bacterium]
MIVRMLRVRIAGPRARLDETLGVLQDLAVLHVDRPPVAEAPAPDPGAARERRHLDRALADVETALDRLEAPASARGAAPAWTSVPPLPVLADAMRRARRVRRRADALATRRSALDDERHVLLRYREFFQAFEALLGHELTWPDGQAFYVVLRRGSGGAVDDVRGSLEAALGGEVELLARALSTGETAVLILASAAAAPRVSSLLAAARVDELPAPAGLGETNLLRALPAIRARLDAIAREERAVDADRAALARSEDDWLAGVRAWLRDRLAQLDARACAWAAEHLFIIEGWLPAARLGDLQARLAASLGPAVVVSPLGAEDWRDEHAPVTLRNPPLFRPFEVLTRMLPLPRYGTIDPTPFVALFFPALFGLMLGDVGYGLMLAALALVLRVRSTPDSALRSVSLVALACASSAVVFGVIFGEFFGSLGARVGLHAFVDREQATIPFLGFAIALGGVHILLGLVLAGLGAWRRGHRREAVGRGVTFAMLVLTVLLLLAVFEVLPRRLFTPLVVAVLVAFVVLVALEGLTAVIELLSTFGHILSYARIMAIGTASLMLAVVANQMVGALGSVLVGAVFALLFHLVNFAIGVFSPTIHALRLHYVEFFGQFFSPGGMAYRPFGHWRPTP